MNGAADLGVYCQKSASVWSPLSSFPSADGSRTLRISIPPEVIAALRAGEANGLRHTCFRTSQRRLLSKVEVRVPTFGGDSRWFELGKWQAIEGEKWQARKLAQQVKVLSSGHLASGHQSFGSGHQSNGFGASGHQASSSGYHQGCNGPSNGGVIVGYPPRVPVSVLQDIREGRLIEVTQRLYQDFDSPVGVGIEWSLISPEGNTHTLSQWMRKEAYDCDMCVPLSKEEAEAFIQEGQILGVRHTFDLIERINLMQKAARSLSSITTSSTNRRALSRDDERPHDDPRRLMDDHRRLADDHGRAPDPRRDDHTRVGGDGGRNPSDCARDESAAGELDDPFVDLGHFVEVTGTGEVWERLESTVIINWASKSVPHFRLTWHNKLNLNKARQTSITPTPWIEEPFFS